MIYLKQFSVKNFRKFLAVGGLICLVYFFLERDSRLAYRIVDGLFVGGIIPFLLGGMRLVKASGTFDLFVYTHRKIWKYAKNHEKEEEENEKTAPGTTETLGSYYEYLQKKEKEQEYSSAYLEPLAAGLLYLAVSLIGTYLVM